MIARPAVEPFSVRLLPRSVRLLSLAVAFDAVALYFAAAGTRGDLIVLPWLIALPLSVLAFRDDGRAPWDRRDVAAVAGLLAVALASRLLFIERWPSFINPDEPIFGLLA